MKRIISLLMALVLLCGIVPAFAEVPDISQLTGDELLLLQSTVDTRLRDLGIYPYLELKKGEKSDEVLQLQARLAELNYFSNEPSGKYDDATVKAVKAFEKANDLKQNGVASIEEQQMIFDKNAVAKPTPSPKPTAKPKPTPKPTPTPDPRKAYEKFDYKSVARQPDYHKGDLVKISGTIIQVLGSRTEGYQLRLATRKGYDDVIYVFVNFDPGFNLLEDDKVTLYCAIAGSITYETVMGNELTIPAANCDILEFR